MRKRILSLYKWLSGALLGGYLTLTARAGSYQPTPETTITYPENDTHAGIVALVVFGVIVLVGVIQIATHKWQDRGDGDKG